MSKSREPIKAMDARMRSRNASKIIAEEELADIFDKIAAACSKGEFDIYTDKKLSSHAKNRLTELGYDYTEKVDYQTRISWYKENIEK